MIETNVFLTRKEMMEVLRTNPGVIIVKFGADWCGPCKQIESIVKQHMDLMPINHVRCMTIDIDEAFDAYAFLKSKKIVNGIPVCLAYYKDNISYIPDEVVIGTDLNEIKSFFATCYNQIQS